MTNDAQAERAVNGRTGTRAAVRSGTRDLDRAASRRSAGVRSSVRTNRGVLEALQGRDLRVWQMRCVTVRNRNAGCHACADACAGGAIAFEDGLLAVDAQRCIGCGTCATVCPTAALEPVAPGDDDLLARCLDVLAACGGRELTVACSELCDACAPHYDEGRVAEVRCLGRVDESLLAALAVAGCERVVLASRACGACAHKAGRAVAERVAACACELLEAWGAPVEVAFEEDVLPEAPTDGDAPAGQGRDRALGAVGGDARGVSAAACATALPRVSRAGVLPQHAPTRRGRLLASLRELGEPGEVTLDTRLWGTVSIDSGECGSCRLCAVFCPTGALRRFEDRAGGAFGLLHDPAQCVQCRCCEDVCRRGALHVSPQVFAPDLTQGHTERFEMRPQEVVPGKPITVVQKMRKLLSGSQQVNFA